MQNATDLIQVVINHLDKFKTEEFISVTLGTLIATGTVALMNTFSLNKRDKLQIEREERKEKELRKQETIIACNFYTNLIRLKMIELQQSIDSVPQITKAIEQNSPIIINLSDPIHSIDSNNYELISDISDVALSFYFNAKLLFKNLNDLENNVLNANNNRAQKLEYMVKISTDNNIDEEVDKIEQDYNKNINIFYNGNTEEEYQDSKMGIIELTVQIYTLLFFSIVYLQKSAQKSSIGLDVIKNPQKYFHENNLKYLKAENTTTIINAHTKTKFSYTDLIKAYQDNSEDILNTAEALAANNI